MKRLIVLAALVATTLGLYSTADAHGACHMFCFYEPNPNGAGGRGYVQVNGPCATSGPFAYLVHPDLTTTFLTPTVNTINVGVQIHYDYLPANNPTAPTSADRFSCNLSGQNTFIEGNCGLHDFPHLPNPVVQCDQQFSR